MKMTDLTALLLEKRETAGAGAPLRVVICGEVSAGKSTVMNALMREHLLPDNIGRHERPLLIAGWREIPGIEATTRDGRELRAALPGEPALFHEADFARLWLDQPHLAGIELIELPMTKAEDLTGEQIDLVASADVFIWVTIGSQAWRLTEKAIVEALGESRPERSILVVSRGDKLRNDSDRGRLMERMERETSSLFAHRLFLFGERRRIAASTESDADWEETGGAALAAILRGFAGEAPAVKPAAKRRAKPVAPVVELVVAAEAGPLTKASVVEVETPAETEPVAVAEPEPPAPAPAERLAQILAEAPADEPETEAEAGPAVDETLPEPEAEIRAEPEQAAGAEPEAPAPAKATPKALPAGLLLAGIVSLGGDAEGKPLVGTAAKTARTGAFCKEMLETLSTPGLLNDESGPLNSFSMSTARRRLLFQLVPETGIVFILVDAAKLNQGLAQVLLNQVCADAQNHISAA